MKTIGLIGGMSWESTVTYYQIINTVVKQQLGGLHSAKCILYSVDFAEIERYQRNENWPAAAVILADAAKKVETGGADFIIICTNTMHKIFDQVQAAVKIPLLHIADLTTQELKKNQIDRVGLLGTKYTMQQDFYKSRLHASGIEVIIPNEPDIELVNQVIYNELCLGIVAGESKKKFLRIIEDLVANGAEGIILGCTEIEMLIKQTDLSFPMFNTTRIHAESAAKYALTGMDEITEISSNQPYSTSY